MIQDDGKVKVIDFGLWRLDQFGDDDGCSAGPRNTCRASRPGAQRIVGKPSDQFSAGAVLYELLEGNPPYAADTWEKSLEKATKWNFDAEALRRSGAPRRLIAVCLKAMAKKPQDRYADCTQFAAALRKAVRPRALAVAGGRGRGRRLGGAGPCALLAQRSTAPPKPPGRVQFAVKVIPSRAVATN